MHLRLISLGAFVLFTAAIGRGETAKNDPPRVGVYDSRAVAYAHFHSTAVTQERDALVARAKTAQADGKTETAAALKKQIQESARRSHLQVFSTAPADEAMAALSGKLPALRTELGVERIVSKWDKAALRDVPLERQIDVTKRLVAEFLQPTEKQRKTLDAIKAAQPIPLWRAKLMTAFGGM